MTEIIYESNKDIIFERTLYKNGRARIAVKDKSRDYIMAEYRYKNAPEFTSPYLNWDNFNCCGGWHYDENYLYTAVQDGKKLYAGITFHIEKETRGRNVLPLGFYSESDVSERIAVIKKDLPDDCVFGSEQSDSTRAYSTLRYIYICKKGAIADHIDIGEVLSAYERHGIAHDENRAGQVKKLCTVPISGFSGKEYMDYANPKSLAELIVAGLLLGYPLETTASLLEKNLKSQR